MARTDRRWRRDLAPIAVALGIAGAVLPPALAAPARGEEGELVALELTPRRLAVCQPGGAELTIDVTEVFGDPPVTLSALNLPAPLSSSISPNPVFSTGSATLSVPSTAGAAAGTYEIAVIGISPVSTQYARAWLAIADAAATPAQLVEPVGPQTDVPRDPELRFLATSEAVHTVEVARDAGFTDVVFSEIADPVPSPVRVRVPDLEADTLYHWRVTSSNPCGPDARSTETSFRTGASYSIGEVASSPGAAIPDDDADGIVDSLDLGTPLTELIVEVEIDHSWVGDLVVRVVHVDTGTSATLLDRPFYPGWTWAPDGCPFDDVRARFRSDPGLYPAESACYPVDPAIGGEYWLSDVSDPLPAVPWQTDLAPIESLAPFAGETLTGRWELEVSDRAAVDSGILRRWCLVGDTGVRYCRRPDRPIPDGSVAGIVDRMDVPFVVDDLELTGLEVTHPYVGDLRFVLGRSGVPPRVMIDRPGIPPGTCAGDDIAELVLDDDGPGGSVDDFCGGQPALTGNLRPTARLDGFDGQPFGGLWQLTASDRAAGDVGSFVAWGLRASGSEPPLFADDFENGDTQAWSETLPPP